MHHQRQISILVAWCALNDLEIDPRLKLVWDPNNGIGVYSKSDIPPHTKLVRVPRHAVLSTKSCCLDEHISSSPYGLGAQLALSLALYLETMKGKFSRWFGYLQSLPHDVVDIPVFWNVGLGTGEPSRRRLEDGREGLMWLRGTEAEKLLQRRTENGRILIEELDIFYHEVAEPLILRLGATISSQRPAIPTLHGFYRAYSLVSSRAFIVDAYHGLCMVPIADAFNHELQNHVHLESDYHVCPECGSLHECSHDRDDLMTAHAVGSTRRTVLWDDMMVVPAADSSITARRAVFSNEEEQEQDYHMVAVTAIPSGIEVFNTYGETLSNAQLLTQYGFILEANDNDHLTWDVDQVLAHLRSDGIGSILHIWKDLCQEDWSSISRSSLVYFDGADANKGPSSLTLNGDGKVSHQQWLIGSLLSVCQSVGKRFRNESNYLSNHLRRLLDAQIILENRQEMEDKSEGQTCNGIDGYDLDSELLEELSKLCRWMIHICADRKAKTGLSSVSDVGEYFDVLSHDKPRTRVAVSLVLNELSLLNSCQAGWTGLLDITTLSKPVT